MSATKRLAPYDDLARLIHSAIETLEIAGTIKNDPDTGSFDFDGYCARACSAYQYLAAHDPRAAKLSVNPGMRLKRLKERGAAYGDSHYWLEDDEGRVLDLIYTDRRRLPRGIPYARGKGASVQKDRKDKTLPASKETQRIIGVVCAALGD